jgi:GNAT superfamily N-acetyltransferase
MEFADKFKVEVLNLDVHKDEFCKILFDLHKHYYSTSKLDSARATLYFDDVMQKNLEKFRIYVCIDSANHVVGFAACYESMSFVELQSDKTIQLQLKELFVRKEFRSKGVGGLLMQRVLDEARLSGYYRVDWNVRDWNIKGINFYKKLGAKFVEDRLSMRIDLDG